MEVPRICDHLQPLADHLRAQGQKVTYAGQAWSSNCRMWIYFDTELDMKSLAEKFQLTVPVVVHTNEDSHSGLERGFVCSEHHDGIMGLYKPPSQI